MKEIAIKKNSIIIEISDEELLMINNSFNEICNGIEVRNFEKKIGISRSQANEILRFISKIYKETQRDLIDERDSN